MKRAENTEPSDASWVGLYRLGGVAALLAGILFRRNLGVEVAMFSAQKQPETAAGWFELLQTNRLLGLTYLSVFDIVNYALVALMFLALYAVLRRANQSRMAVAGALAFLGITAYFATNTAFSLLALSDQYAAAASEAERGPLLAAGQALLALNRFSSAGAHPGSGGFLSLLLVALGGLVASLVMLKSNVFPRAAAYVGFAANGLDLAYCLVFAFAPGVDGELLAVTFIPAAGLFFMAWHILVGWRLFQIGRLQRRAVLKPA